ncbi:MAG: hypothetical protein ABEK03_08430 [Candidatus Bipolaricaulia bacterium]
MTSAISKRLATIALSLAVAFGASAPGWAQAGDAEPAITPSLRPVIISSGRDGLLLGFNIDLGFSNWTTTVGGAYGLNSRKVRYTTGLSYREVASLSYGDWPDSRVRGREGESGIHVGADLIALYRWLGGEETGLVAQVIEQSTLKGTGFVGELWPLEKGEADPSSVRYLNLDSTLQWPLPLGFRLETRGQYLTGQPLGSPEQSFSTFHSRTRLFAGQTQLRFEMGSLDNPVDLPGLEFDLDLRSYGESIRSERYVLASVKQQHRLFTSSLFRIDLARIFGAGAGSLPVNMRLLGSVYFEGGWLLDQPVAEGALFGWGVSLFWPELQTRVTVGINREGEPNLSIETGVLP